MELATLILDYVRALVWPLLVVGLVVRYRKSLDRIVRRLPDAREVTLGKVSWKLREELDDLASSLPPAAQLAVQQKVTESAIDELRLLAREFESATVDGRRRVVAALVQLASRIPVSEALNLTRSVLVGERVAAVVIIGAQLQKESTALENNQALEVLRRGLNDHSSFVRYRYAKILQSHPALADRLRGNLEQLVRTETNSAVRRAASDALAEIQLPGRC